MDEVVIRWHPCGKKLVKNGLAGSTWGPPGVHLKMWWTARYTDNASSNDKMIQCLGRILEDFPGAANHTRCFLHIINLTAQSCIRVFDAPKKSAIWAGAEVDAEDIGDENNDGRAGLMMLVDGIEEEEEEVFTDGDPMEGNELPENTDDWLDETRDLAPEEYADLCRSIVPVQKMLVKVSYRCTNEVSKPTHLITLASQDFVQYPSFHNPSPSPMEHDIERNEVIGTPNASGRANTLEFNVRYVEVCGGVSECHRQDCG